MSSKYLYALALGGVLVNTATAGEFKCYVAAADGKNHIVLNEAQSLDNAATIARSQKATIKANKPAAVTNVIECKPADQSFTDDKARELDESTPR